MASLPDACLLGYPRIPHTGESHALFYTYTHTLNTYTCPLFASLFAAYLE